MSQKIIFLGAIQGDENGFGIPITIGTGPGARTHLLRLARTFDIDPPEPKPVPDLPLTWVYRRRAVRVECGEGLPQEELMLRVKHAILREERTLERIKREVAAFENLDRLPSARRERIPDAVRLFVWQRDEGRCVLCGSGERLEYDHIIPVAEGGSSTERNIQLLCETCNRRKGRRL